MKPQPEKSSGHAISSPKPGGKFVVRDPKTGKIYELRGANSMPPLPLKKGIDLTKPIAKQALRGSNQR